MHQTISQESPSATLGPQSLEAQAMALLTSAGVAPLNHMGWIKVTGADRVRWLNGMATNSVQSLAIGAGCYNFFLNAQGRIQGDGLVFAEPEHLLLETSVDQMATLMPLLDRFIIMDDVELSDGTADLHGLLLAGPRAPELLNRLHLLPPASSTPTINRMEWRSHELLVVRAHSPLVPQFEIWADSASLVNLSTEIALHDVTQCNPTALDLLRIAEGTPLFGVDIRDRDLPQETGAARALHFSKGCYLGQEIVERIHSRGNVHRTFSGFLLHGASAPATLALSVKGKQVGELTSVASLPSSITGVPAHIALGYIRRDALASSKPIEFQGGTALPVSLPFDVADVATL